LKKPTPKKKAKKTITTPLQTKLKEAFSDPNYKPLSRSALLKELNLKPKDQAEAKKLIEEMIENKEIALKGFKLVLRATTKTSPAKKSSNRGTLVKGILRVNPRGFGFLVPEDRELHPEDIFIPKNFTATAVDGDIVEVESFPSSKKDKGPEGKVICILERGRSHLAGLVKLIEPTGEIYLHSPFLGAGKQIKANGFEKKLRHGDRVIVKVDDWGTQNKPILAEITHHLGHISDASLDVPAAVEEFSLRSDFPPEVIKQAKSFGKSVLAKDHKDRLDLTKTECFTIDPSTAKDFDDALGILKDSNGNYKLSVHIADVAHYVKSGTPLDAEALSRCNSTYFPGTCIPMLPEELSNNLCSLKPKVLRLCISVLMTFDSDGNLLNHEIKRTIIKSACRFSYEEAKEVLDGKKKSKYLPSLKLLVELCLLLKKKRYERGCVDFSLPEVVLDINEEGTPTSYHIVEYDITHQLVEECMLKANEITARALASHGTSLIFRTHDEPNSDNLDDFYALSRSLGFFVPAKPTPQDTQKLFEQAKETSFSQQLSIAFIRSMKLANYSPDNIGHYGLSLDDYCHFTSPIRRYPDLIIQRLLFGELSPNADLEQIAELCSEKERISFKAEQTVKTLKKLRLLKEWYTNNPDKKHECFISKIKPFGLQFELPPIGIEGFLHVSELSGDYFIYEEEKKSLYGRHSHMRFCVGDPIEVLIKQIDLVMLEVKWEMASTLENPSPPPAKRSKNRGRKKRRK
jgi:ribonuclease R